MESKYYFTLQLNPDQAYLPHRKAHSPEKVKPFAAFLIAGLQCCRGTPDLRESQISGLVFGSGIREAGSGLGCLAFQVHAGLGWRAVGRAHGGGEGRLGHIPPLHPRADLAAVGVGEANRGLVFHAESHLARKVKWGSAGCRTHSVTPRLFLPASSFAVWAELNETRGAEPPRAPHFSNGGPLDREQSQQTQAAEG